MNNAPISEENMASLCVVGFVGSPRKGMNTDTLVGKVLEGANSVGAVAKIYKVLENADALVIGTPAYYDCVSAQLKLVIDRSNCLTEMIKLSDGKTTFKSRVKKRKKGIFIWVADSSRNPECALATIRLWCKDANVELVNVLTVTDSDRGEGARNQEALLTKAYNIGASLNR